MQLLAIGVIQTQDAAIPQEPGPNAALKPVVGLTDREATLNGDTHPYHVGLIVFGVAVLLIATLVIRRPFLRRRRRPGQSTSLPIP